MDSIHLFLRISTYLFRWRDPETIYSIHTQQLEYARLLREEQVRQDPASEERAEEAWHLPAESEYIPAASLKSLTKSVVSCNFH